MWLLSVAAFRECCIVTASLPCPVAFTASTSPYNTSTAGDLFPGPCDLELWPLGLCPWAPEHCLWPGLLPTDTNQPPSRATVYCRITAGRLSTSGKVRKAWLYLNVNLSMLAAGPHVSHIRPVACIVTDYCLSISENIALNSLDKIADKGCHRDVHVQILMGNAKRVIRASRKLVLERN